MGLNKILALLHFTWSLITEYAHNLIIAYIVLWGGARMVHHGHLARLSLAMLMKVMFSKEVMASRAKQIMET